MYSIPAAQARKGEYEIAIRSYEAIIRKYPDELEPYLRLIEICIVNLADRARAEEIYVRGLRTLKKEASRNILREMYSATLTRLKDAPAEPRRIPLPRTEPTAPNSTPRTGAG
jgi:tetratricopeptide (TPR) repeat protein